MGINMTFMGIKSFCDKKKKTNLSLRHRIPSGAVGFSLQRIWPGFDPDQQGSIIWPGFDPDHRSSIIWPGFDPDHQKEIYNLAWV